jgi:hypothetical protein
MEIKGVRDEIWGEKAKTKSHLRGHMETYYSRRILKIYTYMEESKWSHQINNNSGKQ